MRIVFLSRFQNKIERGAENFVFELSKRLSKKHQVDIFAGQDADSIKKILDGGYDIVVPINGRFQSLRISLARILGTYKILITGHSGIGKDDIWNIVVAKPDVFVALTEYSKRWAKSWAWGSKVVKICNGIDTGKFKPIGEKIDLKLQKPVILSVGALVWYKHHEKAIRAIKEMGSGSLLIVGEGPEKEKLEKLGEQELGEGFKIVNFNYKDMPKVYRSCDLFSLPSWDREAFGIVYLEAMSSGLGVVASNDESRKEIIEDGGLFANVNNPADYAEVIKRALSINWSKKARVQAEKFSWDKIADQYEKLMLSICETTK